MLGHFADQEGTSRFKGESGSGRPGTWKAGLKTEFTKNNPGLCIVQFSVDQVVGVSQHVKDVRELIKKLAGSEASTILIQGESGTGRDLVAHHYESNRRIVQTSNVYPVAPMPERKCLRLCRAREIPIHLRTDSR